ncbi:ankyrin repeat-containing domain protein [Flagelloscypha sp. PMI_526]|nr:ankyrin repeat-containing domain protein [Flagelloscypha sp. PMI_526]
MFQVSQEGEGLRTIAFDGSFDPANALSELLILREAAGRWGWDADQDPEDVHPCKMFDMICGTGIGGFITVLFAALNMTVGQAIQVHQHLDVMLFQSASWLEKDQDGCLAIASKTLDKIAELLGVHVPLDQLFSLHAFAKGFVCVVNSVSPGRCRLLRNYRSRLRSPSCTIREALLVCLSDCVHIAPISIHDEQFQNAVDGFANPTRIMMQELSNAFRMDCEVACLVNIGAGRPSLLPLSSRENAEEITALLRSCDLVAEDVAAQCFNLGSFFFFRFSLFSSADYQYSIDSDFTSLMKGLTTRYLSTNETSSRLDDLVDALKQRPKVVSPSRLRSFAGEDVHSRRFAAGTVVQQHLDDITLRDMNAWLQPIHQTSKLDMNIRARRGTTCRWLLNNFIFMRWMKAARGLFWFRGLMGTGKTVTSSLVIETLLTRDDIHVAYYYFELMNPSTLSEEALFRSLVAQLAGASLTTMRTLYQRHNNGGLQPQLNTLCTALEELVSASPKPVFIVVDALDELPLSQRKYLLQTILTFSSSNGASKTHIMLTSREEVDILRAFEGKVDFELGVQGDLVRQDIAAFVDRQLEDEKWKVWPQDEIEKTRRLLNERADGQFRMVACQVDLLHQVKDLEHLQRSLHSFPKSLHETYNYILAGISQASQDQAHRLFAILSFASKRISTTEISALLAVELSSEEDSGDLPEFRLSNYFHDHLDVMGLGTSLVSRVEDYGITYLQLAHSSVREHLLAPSCSWFSLDENLAHNMIASAALALLLHFQVLEEKDQRRHVYPYSRDEWYTHVFPHGPLLLLQQQQLLYASFPWMYNSCMVYSTSFASSSKEIIDLQQKYPNRCSKLESAVYFGLVDLVEALLRSRSWDSDALTSSLIWAARSSREEVLSIQCCGHLLSLGANVNTDTSGPLALQEAAIRDKYELVSFLIDKGVEVNAAGGYYGTALQAAACYQSLDMMSFLLSKGADVNALGGDYGTALQRAAYQSSLTMVQFLLEKGADVNKLGGRYGTALHAATYAQSLDIVLLLAEKGANVNALTAEYGTVLHVAAWRRSPAIVRFLIEKGANTNVLGERDGTALQIAALQGSLEITTLLLVNGADLNLSGGTYGTALQAAAYKGSQELVQYLVEMGADINTLGGKYGTALQASAYSESLKMVQFLIKRGADTNIIGGEFGTALIAAAWRGSLEIVTFLVENGASVNAVGGRNGTALDTAQEQRWHSIVQYLKSRRAKSCKELVAGIEL